MFANLLLALGLGAFLLYIFLIRNFSYWKKKNVVSPEPVLFFGNIKDTFLRRIPFSVFYQNIYNAFPNEKVVGLYRTWTPALVVRDLDLLKHIMIKDFDDFFDRGIEISTKGLGMNLFHTDGDTWRVLRSRLSPMFTSGKLKSMMYLMEEQAQKFIEITRAQVSVNPEMDAYQLTQMFTLGTIGSCAFGIDLDMNTVLDPNGVLARLDKLIFRNQYSSELDMMFPGILKKLDIKLFPTFVCEFFEGMVKQIMKERNEKPSGRKDFMDLMLELKNVGEIQGRKKYENEKERTVQITDELMAAQAFVFYAAGYETSASTVSFLLHQLALHQGIQDRVVEEMQQVLQKNKGVISYDSLMELNYLGRVFDETLRMFPLVDPLQRMVCTSRYQLPGTEVTVERGTIMLIPVRGIHHDPAIYPEPELFDPDRFLPENVKERHICAYLPFGVGPRNCIGMRFAHVQSRVLLVHLLTRFRVEPCAATERSLTFHPRRFLLAARNGIKLRLVPRD